MRALRLDLPYPTIVGLEQAFGIVAGLAPGTRVDRILLLGQGFAPNGVGPILDAFRWLGLIDGAGGGLRPIGRQFLAEPAPVARAALAPVVARLSPPYSDRKHLVEALRPLLGRDDTTVPLAATFLDWVARKAGVELIVRPGAKPGARAGVPRPRRPASVLRARVRAAEKAGQGTAPAVATPGPEVSFQLVIDRNTSPDDLDRMVQDVKQAMARLGGNVRR